MKFIVLACVCAVRTRNTVTKNIEMMFNLSALSVPSFLIFQVTDHDVIQRVGRRVEMFSYRSVLNTAEVLVETFLLSHLQAIAVTAEKMQNTIFLD